MSIETNNQLSAKSLCYEIVLNVFFALLIELEDGSLLGRWVLLVTKTLTTLSPHFSND